ncbi:AEC family transporter [Chloroflexota bacterium]
MPSIIEIVLPTFIVILIGYLIGKLTKLNMAPVVDITVYIGTPALVFVSLLSKDIVLLNATKIWAAAVIIMIGCGIFAWLVFKIIKQRHSALYVPISIMNSVNIPFPVAYFAYGVEGLIAATLYSIPNILLMNSLGIYIMAGKQWQENIKEILKIPIIYAACIGLVLNLFNVDVPELAISSLDFIAMMALPLTLLVLGHNLSIVKISSFPTTILASFLRVGIGLIIGLLVVNIFDITGVFRAVVILNSAMPAAVMSSIFATKYNNEAELVSSVVFLTTIASLIVVPFLLSIVI